MLTLLFTDCGELKGPDADVTAIRGDDGTGDKYEDFPDDENPEMDGSTILRIATELKEFGNKAFKGGDLELGLEKYTKGLRYLDEYPVLVETDPPELFKNIQALRFVLLSNSALLQNKQKLYREGEEAATKALLIPEITGTDKAKALFRRATAKAALKDDGGALEDLKEANKYAPGDAAVLKELGAAKERVQAKKDKESAAYKKFFG